MPFMDAATVLQNHGQEIKFGDKIFVQKHL